ATRRRGGPSGRPGRSQHDVEAGLQARLRRIQWPLNSKISFGDTKGWSGAPRNCGGIFEGARLDEQLAETEQRIASPDFWNNQTTAQQVMQQRRRLEDDQALRISLRKRADDIGVLLEWATAGEDVTADLARGLDELQGEIDAAETKKMLSGQYDRANA